MKKLVAYTDGSFNNDTNVYGSGAVILDGDKVIQEIKVSGNDSKLIASRNITGEVRAVVAAIVTAQKHQATHLEVIYDLQAIGKWADNTWKANKPIAKNFKAFLDTIEDLEITFTKVKGHSGVQYNDHADALAREACGLA